jgi:hypothetical protein
MRRSPTTVPILRSGRDRVRTRIEAGAIFKFSVVELNQE